MSRFARQSASGFASRRKTKQKAIVRSFTKSAHGTTPNRKGGKSSRFYHLEGVSGKAVSNHPEAQRMLKDLRNARITGLIFTKLARLARNTRELIDFAEHFREMHGSLISEESSTRPRLPGCCSSRSLPQWHNGNGKKLRAASSRQTMCGVRVPRLVRQAFHVSVYLPFNA
jgi:hypothetical protein